MPEDPESLIQTLQAEIDRLMVENLHLRSLLGEKSAVTISENSNEDHEFSNINDRSLPEEKIELFRTLFRGRNDVYPKRWISVDGSRSGYSPVFDTTKGFQIPKEQR